MNNLDTQLKELYQKILSKERYRTDRTGYGTKSVFGHQMRFNMQDGFPLTTLRKIHIKSMIHELLWFLGSYDDYYKQFGNTNIKYLLDNGVTFWTDWAYKNYYADKFKKYQGNDLIDSKTVKKFRFLSQKDFEKKIIKDDEFALKWGDLGPVYGKQWKDWGGYHELVEKKNIIKETAGDHVLVDKLGWEKIYMKGINQIDKLVNMIIENPDSRRLIVNAWNVADIDDMLLPPCHAMFQCYTDVITMEQRIEYCEKTYEKSDVDAYMLKNQIVDWDEIKRDPRKQIKILDHFNVPERTLDLQLYMRSNDIYLGNPYNISMYSLLLHMIAQVTNTIPNDFILSIGDAHIYANAIGAIEELLKRDIRPLPKLWINPDVQNIYGFRYEDFKILDYNPHENIKVEVAV
jgi:thymidylate synthase